MIAEIGTNLSLRGWVQATPGPNCQPGLWRVEFCDNQNHIRIRLKAPDSSIWGGWAHTDGDLMEVSIGGGLDGQYLYIWFDESESRGRGDYTTESLGGTIEDGIVVKAVAP